MKAELIGSHGLTQTECAELVTEAVRWLRDRGIDVAVVIAGVHEGDTLHISHTHSGGIIPALLAVETKQQHMLHALARRCAQGDEP
jgi:hypothetical protein